MPKNNDCRSKLKLKSTRKPLRDVTNTFIRFSSKKNAQKKEEVPVSDEVAFDRLLLVHSNLSPLIHQIDELVSQVSKVINKRGIKEVGSLVHFLSEMETSFKQWVPKFQKILSSLSLGSENGLQESLTEKIHPALHEGTVHVIDSPDPTKLDAIVSPSPLVSWHADCTTESGRLLFLLTPLPQPKAFSSRLQGSSKSIFEKIASNSSGRQPSLLEVSGDTNDHILDAVAKLSRERVPDSAVTKMRTTMESGFVSPAKFSKRDCSMVVMTPSLKMSPPKSCVLLEPIYEAYLKDKKNGRKSTPFPIGIQNSSESQESEYSNSQFSDNLALKYPELFGIKQTYKLVNRKKVIEESPNWLMSPLKTCVLMEPADEPGDATDLQLTRTSIIEKQTDLPLKKEKDTQICASLSTKYLNKGDAEGSAVVDATPLWGKSENIDLRRNPGENTLKRELWTKFEAVSTHALHFNASVFQESSKKDFLDLLNEAL